MKAILLIFRLLFVNILFIGAAQADATAGEAFFNSTWGNLQEELETARDQDKKAIFLFFEMDECPFCRRMKQTILNRPEVLAYFKANFMMFPIDIEGDTELTDFAGNVTTAKAFAETIRVRATPVMMFFDLQGQPLYRHTGPTRDAQEFLWLGEFVADGHYLTDKFSNFRRAKQAGQ